MTTLHSIDPRGCELHATRAEGSPIVTVRASPKRIGVVSWRLPSVEAMRSLAMTLQSDGETLEYLSHTESNRDGTPAVRTFLARKA